MGQVPLKCIIITCFKIAHCLILICRVGALIVTRWWRDSSLETRLLPPVFPFSDGRCADVRCDLVCCCFEKTRQQMSQMSADVIYFLCCSGFFITSVEMPKKLPWSIWKEYLQIWSTVIRFDAWGKFEWILLQAITHVLNTAEGQDEGKLSSFIFENKK